LSSRGKLRLIQPSSGRSNRTLFIRDQEIEEATVGEAERHFCPPPVKVLDVEIVDRHEPPFDFEVGRHNFLFGVGEVLVHSEVVMDSPEVGRSFEHFTVVGWLFN
jgi:hypothetical protein